MNKQTMAFARQEVLTEREVHARVKKAIESGDLQARTAAFHLAKRRKRNEKPFFGHGSWAKYLLKEHGIVIRDLKKIRDLKIHRLVASGLKRGIIASRQWSGYAYDREVKIAKRFVATIYGLAESRKVNGKSFFGCGSWDAYLEKFHGVVPVEQQHWSTERVHVSIAALLKKYPPGKVRWARNSKYLPIVGNLNKLYQRAYRSNKPQYEKNHETFFGHGNWKNYVAWLRAGGHLKGEAK